MKKKMTRKELEALRLKLMAKLRANAKRITDLELACAHYSKEVHRLEGLIDDAREGTP